MPSGVEAGARSLKMPRRTLVEPNQALSAIFQEVPKRGSHEDKPRELIIHASSAAI
jgi:hypothetical protein